MLWDGWIKVDSIPDARADEMAEEQKELGGWLRANQLRAGSFFPRH
jgi:hypothetical protein